MSIPRFLKFIFASIVLGYSALPSCESKVENNPLTKTMYFNQTLLRDAIPYLEEQFDVKIRTSNRIQNTNDLWLNYETSDRGESIDQILDGVVQVLAQDHRLKIEVVKQSSKVYLLK